MDLQSRLNHSFNLWHAFAPELDHCSIENCAGTPEFRLVEIESAALDEDGRPVEHRAGITILCRPCAANRLRQMRENLEGLRTEEVPGRGLLLLPLHITPRLAADLRTSITLDVRTGPVKPASLLTSEQEASFPARLANLSNIPVENLDLTVRAYNCLKNANVETVGELCQHSREQLLKTKNFGKKTLNFLEALLAGMGLKLAA